MRRARANGAKLEEIAYQFGRSRYTIGRHVAGVDPSTPHRRRMAIAERAYIAGLTFQEIIELSRGQVTLHHLRIAALTPDERDDMQTNDYRLHIITLLTRDFPLADIQEITGMSRAEIADALAAFGLALKGGDA
ncbi:hypothetical protein [Parvularcula sp. LCG005]|uniref:hypothetical protein n=1 Tax=Parvularcula sp. LCG005 TaxID=3078805 RepID=UPI002942AAFA|nr:hypothetical protein [Parvularcula sp. LCG005]WOI51962.1 hypothetical protein RUI03_07310 [Parvularcula sp. LCG005]